METGLILAVPDLRDAVEVWRAVALPAARLDVPPHLTVLYPWVPREPTEEDSRRVQEATHNLRRFTINFREVGAFPGFVWLRPEPSEAVLAVQSAVAAEFTEFPPYAGEHPVVVPHLTVATCETVKTRALAARAAAMLAAYDLGPFNVQGVDVAVSYSEVAPLTVHRIVTFRAGPHRRFPADLGRAP